MDQVDFVQGFIDFASKAGCAPAQYSDIVADDARHYYCIEGDKAAVKKGAYQLRVDGDFAVGWCINYREGITYTYTSKSARKLSVEEKLQWKAKIEARKKEQFAQQAQRYKEAAAKAKDVWDKAARSGEHDYLKRKQCALNGARIAGDKLVVPIYKDGKLTSLQFISPDGDKMFLAGGEISGGWFPIADKDQDKSVILIGEGFATMSAVRSATGLPVIIGFNAGNLIAVAKSVRAKYPTSQIVIAADADVSGVGQDKAAQAAASIGGALVVTPPANGVSVDWNDVYIKSGAQAVKQAFDKALHAAQPESLPDEAYIAHEIAPPEWLDDSPPLEAYDDEERKTVALYVAGEKEEKTDWKEKLFYKDDGKLAGRNLGNCQIFLEHDKILGNLFCYDEFCHERVLYRCPPWDDVKKFKPRPITDDDITHLGIQLERRGIQQPFNTVARVLSSVIRKNSRNPAQEYFNGLTWDGIRRLDNWLIDYCGAKYDDEEYVQAIGRKWLTAAVSRIFNPGCKFDSMLILEGEQNAGKSLILRKLATIHGREYFNDSIKISDLAMPDKVIMKLQGCIIIELAELSSFARMSDEEKKAVLSIQTDIATLKYQNEAGHYPRQFVLAGTTNNGAAGYLTDNTGNRRIWCVKVSNHLDINGIDKDKEQLWAEAVTSYHAGEKLYLEDELYVKAQEIQQSRMSQHPWQSELEALAYDQDIVFMTEIWKKLEITIDKRNKALSRDIGGIMTGLGFESKQRRLEGYPSQAWVRKIREKESNFDDSEAA